MTTTTPTGEGPHGGQAGSDLDPAALGHPRGTLAIVVLYGILFALLWGGLYVFEFIPRGTPHP